MLDIIDAATDLQQILSSIGRDAFLNLPRGNRIMYRAIKNALSEIGEAAKTIPNDIRGRRSEVDWRGLAGLRDIVVHNYGALDASVLLFVVTNDVPTPLAAAMAELAWVRNGLS